MKSLLVSAMAVLCCVVYAKDLKVLAIGNSFSVCVTRNLPQIVASVPGNSLEITSAQIGGCSLEKHWNNIVSAEKDPAFTPYSVTVINSKDLKKNIAKCNVNTLLKKNKYDVITIQQNSLNSINYATYQPFGKNLIAYIKKHQPQAEIIIQQTWSYRNDAARLKRWKFDNTVMYNKLAKAYADFAVDSGLRLIPSGYAVQIFRAETPVKFKAVPNSDLKNYKQPDVPGFEGSVVGKHLWRKHRETGEIYLTCDANHLNTHGEYMQAAVWFQFLFEQPATSIKYIQPGMSAEQAKFLLNCAEKAVSTFKQPVK